MPLRELRFHFGLPPSGGLPVREIEIGRLPAPELRDVRAAFVLAVADETAEAFHLRKAWMVEEHGGLHIRNEAHACVCELLGERGGIGKAGAVPGKT